MLEVVETIYKNGAFVPEKTFNFDEGARVKIVVETLVEKKQNEKSIEETANLNAHVQAPTITDPEERKKIIAQIFKSFDENPIPADAPRRFTREEMYERR